MSEEVDYAREAYEWKRFAVLMFRIAITLGVCILIALGLVAYLLWGKP